MVDKEAILKISEAFQQDVGYGRARIDHQTRMNLDLSIGDVIALEGTKKTSAVVWRAHPTDEGKGIIRIDNLTRKNSGAGLGDRIKVKRANVKEAKSISLAPLISKGQQIQFGSGIDNLIKKGLLKRPLTKGDNVIIPGIALFGSSLPFVIINTTPEGVVSISDLTDIKVKEEAAKEAEEEGPRVSYEDIGGLHEEISKVREMIELPLKHPEVFNRLGIDPPKGVLLHGPPGTGKTLIAKAVANESGASFYTINGPEVMSKFYGQSEENLRKIFEEAEKNAPSIIFIDEIDAIAPKRSEVHGEVERRVVSQMLTLMDGLKGRGNLIVIGATNLPDVLDPALRRPGRFDREIKIDAPDMEGRKEILQIHTRGMPISAPFYSSIVIDELRTWLKQIELPKLKNDLEKYEGIFKKSKKEKEGLEKKISSLKKNQKSLEEENGSLEEELTNLELKLENLKEEYSINETSRLTDLINKFSIKKREVYRKVNDLKDEISKITSNIEENKKEVSDIESNIEEAAQKIKDILDKIKDKEALEKIELLIKKIKNADAALKYLYYGEKEIERWIKLLNPEDPRVQLISNRKNINELIDKHIEDEEVKKRLKAGFNQEIKKKVKDASISKFLGKIAEITYGYVGADLAALARESAMNALRRYLPEINLEEPIPTEILEKMEVTLEDFKSAHRGIEPSAMREFLIEVPKVSWDDVGGLECAKQQLKEAVEWPLTKPEVFKNMGIKPPRGVLLYGAPGTGKTLLAKAVAHESSANFISIKGPEVMSKWVGESEKAVRELFKKARQVAPTIVFLDELDSIAPMRGTDTGSHVTDSVVNQLLTSIDGMESMEGVVVVGATNRPDIIDQSLLRPGRFDRLVLIGSPNKESRHEILKIHTKGMPLDKDVDLLILADITENYSGADLESLCREAAMLAIREDDKIDKVSKKHFDGALESVRASITPELVKFYSTVAEKLGSGIAKKDKKEKDIQYM